MFRNLILGFALAAGSVASAASLTPDILVPDHEKAMAIVGLSNNGKYGVASIQPDEDGNSNTLGAVFYDFTGSKPVYTDLTLKHSAVGATDVTDDGKTVVGTVDLMPGYCRNENGTWTWHTLPIPNRRVDMPVEDFTTGEESVATYSLNGGTVSAVSPDGRYAVGLARCNEYELFEQAVMWDLSTGKIIDVPSPTRGIDGEEYYQTRYMQLSDNGRYLLCYNAFSYSGGVVFVFDRQTNEPIYIDVEKNPDGSFSPRLEGYHGLEIDGVTKSLTSDGRYVSGGINGSDGTYIFLFDVPNRKLTVFNDGIHDDVTGWSVTKDGMALGATPAMTPYADAMVCYDDFLFPMSLAYEGVYGLEMEAKYGIDNTGKPTLISDDGRSIIFITSRSASYLLRLKEDLRDLLKRVNLMSGWTASPREGTRMSAFTKIAVSFENPVECDASKYTQVKLLDADGNLVANPLANGGIQTDGNKLNITFRARQLDEGKTYTLHIPEGICWVKGRPTNTNEEINIKYEGRANKPVAPKNVSPADGTSLASIDLADNPIVVTFDVPVQINPSLASRPIAHLYVDDADEPAASLTLDVDLYTNTLVAYPAAKVFLYKGSDYHVRVPEGAVCDLSGQGPSEALSVTYKGSYVPQLGDEQYLFRSQGDDFSNLLFYDGDKGTPIAEYADMGFTADATPWWVVMDEGVEDMAFASHSCYTDGRASNDWLVTRQIKVPDGVSSYLKFQSQSYRKGKEDRLKVYIYENNFAFNQLTAATIKNILEKGDLVYDEIQSPGNSEQVLAGEWTDNTIPLDDYRGKSINICFLNDNCNQSMVMIDNIEVLREVKAFLTMTNQNNVVGRDNVTIKGILTVASDLAEYSKLEMSLSDGKGNEISSLSQDFETPLKPGDIYSFEFPQPLPLTVGEENPYTISFSLDADDMQYKGTVRNLAFETTKRVVVEEYTGRDCQYCPLGILAMENLEERYGEQVVPIVLHSYNSDPKGFNITDYSQAVFSGNSSAPNGRINRRNEFTAPMFADNSTNRYHYSASEVPGAAPTWLDVVNEELAEPTFLDISLAPVQSTRPNYVNYTATVKSALNLDDQNVRVLGMLMEDGIVDRQQNGLHSFSDEALGQFGKGGQYGYASIRYTFNNVARGFWGQSANGTPRLIPASLETGKEYSVDIEYAIPAIVEDASKLKMAVVLIDENTGRVINAAVENADISGVEDIVADESAAEPVISSSFGEISVVASGDVEVAVYALDGRLLAHGTGRDTVSVSLHSFKGVAIVRAACAGKVTSKKLVM